MLDLIMSNVGNISVIILFIVGILYLIKKNQISKVSKILFYLVIKAEKEFGGGTGSLKYSAVTAWLYERLPTIIKILFTDNQIDKMIENAVGDMKKYLESNINANLLIID